MYDNEEGSTLSMQLKAKIFRQICFTIAVLNCLSCASILQHKDSEKLLKIDEFDQRFNVKDFNSAPPKDGSVATVEPGVPSLPPVLAPQIDVIANVNKGDIKGAPGRANPMLVGKREASKSLDGKQAGMGNESALVESSIDKKVRGSKKSKRGQKSQIVTEAVAPAPDPNLVSPAVPKKHEPDLEDGEGFDGRRPLKDPYRVGEKVTLEMSFFGVAAGLMTLETREFKEVNGRKAYHFVMTGKSSTLFSQFYAVDDWSETFVDFETMTPFSYSLHVKESKQLREVRSYFDWDKMMGFLWDKKVTKDGAEEKKYEWAIQKYVQNAFSAPFYLRSFLMEPGKKLAIRVGHEGKNMVVTGEVLRREVLNTEIGNIKTLVMKPKIEIDGALQPVGDIFFWFTDDDRRQFVRIESKIRIGTIVGQVVALDAGK